ncbi:SDR family oxidoreductase [Oleidesulfovibrio alaskensis]|jgi:3-oxoacyl-[acyl-carrier protein] reductase|uniref:SDR family oxidoreductase n=1 Tax=Oleidesulfovibrio alaskensis TaxID=58180 RepID=UPI001A5244A2|nr:SDR family oxidoreductase [Oleidesulfovibrio alaskensis]MBL3582167.1 SDR family oxidoreductase [Oleidesulfovibrio alaskensis]
MRLSHTRGCVLVAGGGSALGTASATLLARAGVPLCLTAGSAEAAARIHNAFSAAHLSCPPVLIVRMEDTARADALPEQAAAAAGMPAAYLLDLMHTDHESLLASASPDTISAYIEANITWRARLVRAVSRHMLHRRCGRMVFVSSTAAALPAAGQGLYAAAKLAAEALYRSTGTELAARGITTCSLRLGYVAAGRGARYLKQHPDLLQRIPLQRAVDVHEAAGALAFLLSDGAAAINATAITMDGGLTACK